MLTNYNYGCYLTEIDYNDTVSKLQIDPTNCDFLHGALTSIKCHDSNKFLKIKQLITFSFILLSLGATSNIFAQNTAIPTFYFDNQEGLVEAEDCSISPIESQTFRISSYSGKNKSKQIENLRNLNGVRQSHLINGSLVKLIKCL